MDSGNSGSMQSSSCGEDQIEEYDSRAAFIHNQQLPTLPTTTTTITRMSHLINQPTQSSSLQHHQQMFDPLIANYYMDNSLHNKSSSSNQNSFLNLDHMMWSKATTTARSELLQNNNDLSSLMIPSSSSSSSQQNQQAFLLSQMVGQTRENVGSVSTTHHSLQQLDHQNVSRGASLTNDQQSIGKNPKKRSRASRRAPTTVLTTDTTNFRAMVQEFTGIPAQPFSSPFPRTRLDLFGSSRSISSSSSSQMDPLQPQPPPYLLRPFAQKIQTPNHFSSISSSMVENFVASSNNSTNNNSATINNYQQNLQHLHQHPLMQQHNQILGFQSISQTPTTKYSIGTHQPSLEISPNVDPHVNNNNSSSNNIGVLLHQKNMVPTSSDRINNNMRNSSENHWGQRTTSGSTNNINGDGDGDNRGIVGSLSSIEERNCTSDFGVEKGQECVTTTRGEGTVESWINCSSSD